MSMNPAINTPSQPKKGKGPIILVIVGVVIGLVSLIAMIVVGSQVAVKVADYATQSLDYNVGSASVNAKAGDKVIVLTDTTESLDLSGCSLFDESGNDAASKVSSASEADDMDFGGQWKPTGAFVVKASGTYNLVCSEDKPLALVVMPVSDTGAFVGAGIGILLCIVGGFIGFALFVSGIIWLIVRHVRGKQAESAGAAQWQQSAPQPQAQWQQNPQGAWRQPAAGTPAAGLGAPAMGTPTQPAPQPQQSVQPQWTQDSAQ